VATLEKEVCKKKKRCPVRRARSEGGSSRSEEKLESMATHQGWGKKTWIKRSGGLDLGASGVSGEGEGKVRQLSKEKQQPEPRDWGRKKM